MFEVAGVNRINSAEHHRMNFLKTWQRIARGTTLVGDSVADFHIGSGFDVRDEVTDVPGTELRLHEHLRGKHADLLNLITGVVAH